MTFSTYSKISGIVGPHIKNTRKKENQLAKVNNVTIGMIGAGGDGVVRMGSLLQRLYAAQGFFGQMPKFYGAQIRGGGSAVKLNLNADYPSLPNDTLDILVSFSWEKYAEFSEELHTGPQTFILCEQEPPLNMAIEGRFINVKFTELGKQITGEARNKNILALGILSGMLGASSDTAHTIIDTDENFKIVKKNLEIYNFGFELSSSGKNTELPVFELAMPSDPLPKQIVSGNDMVVEGAMAAGCHACFGYPITPASEIAEDMSERLVAVDGAFRQVEDEIAAIMYGIGASLTGSKTLIPTSGPGLSLMTESLGLAIGLEVPLVLVDVQRGGPSTGAPTKTEQSDLFHALYGGHGDAPRIVVAPYDIESVFNLTIESFNISEFYQTPVIFLTDQFLGQTPTALCKDFLNKPHAVVERLKRLPDDLRKYKRYEDTPDHISPMTNIGDINGIYQTAGLSHKEDGSHEPSLKTQEWWHKKLSLKLKPLELRDDLVQIYGNPSAKNRIITWGSSAQAVHSAIQMLKMEDRISLCIPQLIAPLPKKASDFVETAENLMVIEMNASAQFYRYLRSMAYPPRTTNAFHRSGTRPFGIGEIMTAIVNYFSSCPESEVR